MALWILSLGDPPKAIQSLPLQGDYVLTAEKDGKPAPQGAFVFRATYQDRGAAGQPRLQRNATLVLRPAVIQAEQCDKRSDGVGNYKPFNNDTVVLNELKHNAWFAFNQVDLRGLKSLTLRLAYGDKTYAYAGGRLEIHRGSLHGEIIAETSFDSRNGERMRFEERQIPLNLKDAVAPLKDLYFVFRNLQNQGQGVIGLDWIRFDF